MLLEFTEVGVGGSRLTLTDVNTTIVSGLNQKFVCCFKLVVDMVRHGIRQFVYNMDTPAFLKRDLVSFGVDKYR